MFDTGSLSAILSGVKSQQQPVVAPATAPAPTGPFGNLSAILSGDANYGQVLQKIGGGMANMGNAGGDPYLAFAQGFGGAQKFTTEEQRLAAERAAAAEKAKMDANLALQRLTQDQSQHSASLGQNQSQFDARTTQDQAQFDQRMELERAAEKRQQQIADAATQKSAAEIKRQAKREDISDSTMLQIEKLAREAVPEFTDPEEAKQIMEAERQRLIAQVKSQRLSDGPGVTEADTVTAPTATTPKVGDVVDGFQYLGGDPNDSASWKAQ